MRGHYRTHLQAAVATSAAPYGYTLTVWTSGAVTMHARCIPSALEALLFPGRGGRRVRSGRRRRARKRHPGAPGLARREGAAVGRLHLPSVGAGIGAVALVSELIHDSLAWPVAGFLATGIYLLVIAAQFTIAA